METPFPLISEGEAEDAEPKTTHKDKKMTLILKQGYEYRTYNQGELPCADYVQAITTTNGRVVAQRSKGTLRSDGDFGMDETEFFLQACPEAFESLDNYEIIWGNHPLYGDDEAGDCWVQIFRGMDFRAFRK